MRVFSRIAALKGHAKSTALCKLCWRLAEDLLDPKQPAAFNQALMELGATVCTPLAPHCGRCPLQRACKAYQLAAEGTVASVTCFPAKYDQKHRRQRVLALAAVADASGAWMLVRRPPHGLLAGQLEFPAIQLPGEERREMQEASAEVMLHLQEMLGNFGIQGLTLTPLSAPIEHVPRPLSCVHVLVVVLILLR